MNPTRLVLIIFTIWQPLSAGQVVFGQGEDLNDSGRPKIKMMSPTSSSSGEDDPSRVAVSPNTDFKVLARVLPSNLDPLKSVSLEYLDNLSGFDVQSIAMVDDGLSDDGIAFNNIYGAQIPAFFNWSGKVVRYRVVAEAEITGIIVTSPKAKEPLKDEKYYGYVVGDASQGTEAIPVVELFVPNSSEVFRSAEETTGMMRYGRELYDFVGFSRHGQGSLNFPKRSLNVDLPKDHKLKFDPAIKAVTDFNILTNWSDRSKLRNSVTYAAFAEVGVPAPLAFPVKLEVNGTFAGLYDFVEEGNKDFLDRVGLSDKGALYKMNQLMVETCKKNNPQECPTKKNPEDDDYSDYNALVEGINQDNQEDVNKYLYDHVDFAAMANFVAALEVVGHHDCCHKNYYMYRDTKGTRLWSTIPWDVDLSMGRFWTQDDKYWSENLRSDWPLKTINNNKLLEKLFSIEEFDLMFRTRMRTVMNTLLGQESNGSDGFIYRKVDEAASLIGDLAQKDDDFLRPWGIQRPGGATWHQNEIKNNYVPRRRAFLNAPSQHIPTRVASTDGITIIKVDPRSDGRQDLEYIEIRNGSSQAIDLSDWKISGDIKFKLAPGTVLPSHRSLYICNELALFVFENPGQMRLMQGNFSGDTPNKGKIKLANTQGQVVSQYQWDEGESSEQIPEAIKLEHKIEISEFLAHSDYPYVDAIELYNPNDQEVSLHGFQLSDRKSLKDGYIHTIGAGISIDAHGYLSLRIVPSAPDDPKDLRIWDYRNSYFGPEDIRTFGLKAAGDRISLWDASGKKQDDIEFDTVIANRSYGWYRNSKMEKFLVPFETQSLESKVDGTLQSSGPNSGPYVGPLVISEYLHSPQDGKIQFIEIKNVTDSDIILNGYENGPYRVKTESSEFYFPASSKIRSHETIVLIQNDDGDVSGRKLKKLLDENNIAKKTQVFFFTFRLSPVDRIEIQGAERFLPNNSYQEGSRKIYYYTMDRVDYQAMGDWPQEALEGFSVKRKRVNEDQFENASNEFLFEFGNDPLSWKASTNQGGNPGK